MEDKLARSRTTSSDDTIDPTLVRPIEASFLRTLDAQHAEQDNALRDIKTYTESGELEFQVDKLYQTLHTVTQFTEIADKFGSKVLEEAERVLSERDERVERAAGTDGWDVQMLLQQITRV
jgi:hypothetical protein